MESQKRQIAYKVRIRSIMNGNYVKEGGWQPNYVQFNGMKISRVNVIGTVVAKSEDGSFLLDDGSSRVSVRYFQQQIPDDHTTVGDTVLLIGRVREYASERYVVPEIVKKITNRTWIDVRKLELQNSLPKPKKQVQTEQISEEVVESSPTEKIYSLIRQLDKGDGADIDEIIHQSKENDAEKIIHNLLEKGEVFEMRKGRLKVLE